MKNFEKASALFIILIYLLLWRLSTALAAPRTTINYNGVRGIGIDGGGGVAGDTVTVNGTGANNAFTVAATAAQTGSVQVDGGPAICRAWP